MKEILLSNCPGSIAVVDDEDFARVSGFCWRLSQHGYAIAHLRGSKPYKSVFLHRLIAGTPEGMVTDHIDGNPLNNCRSNLRICTHRENCWNTKKRRGTLHSKFKGVTWFFNRQTDQGYWVAQIAGERIGYFNSEVEAALAYDAKAKDWFGEFATLNFSDLTIVYTYVLNRDGLGVRSPLDLSRACPAGDTGRSFLPIRGKPAPFPL